MLAARTSIHVESYESDYQHPICGFFRNPKEEYRLLGSFVGEDIERGQKTFRIVNPRGAIKTEPNEI